MNMDLFSNNFDYGALLQWDEEDGRSNEDPSLSRSATNTNDTAIPTEPNDILQNNDKHGPSQEDMPMPSAFLDPSNDLSPPSTSTGIGMNDGVGVTTDTSNNANTTTISSSNTQESIHSSDVNNPTRRYPPYNGFITAMADPSSSTLSGQGHNTPTSKLNDSTMFSMMNTLQNDPTVGSGETSGVGSSGSKDQQTSSTSTAQPNNKESSASSTINMADESYRMYTSHLLAGNLMGNEFSMDQQAQQQQLLQQQQQQQINPPNTFQSQQQMTFEPYKPQATIPTQDFLSTDTANIGNLMSMDSTVAAAAVAQQQLSDTLKGAPGQPDPSGLGMHPLMTDTSVPLPFTTMSTLAHTQHGHAAMLQQQQQQSIQMAQSMASATESQPESDKKPDAQQGTTQATSTKEDKSVQNQNQPPPFHLFDATCELRNNFALAQKAMNLPQMQDNNSFHYGMAVNGFHPQLNAQHNPITPLSSSCTLPNVKLLDVRSTRDAGKKAKPDRNEREQQRAHKITELIKELRGTMIRGGWKIEMKSKFQTLSSCADYMKHLIKLTKEKQIAVQKAQADLTARQQKLEEETALQEFRSDRDDSVTSDVTMTTSTQNYSTEESSNLTSIESDGRKKRKNAPSGNCSPKDGQVEKKCKTNSSGGNSSGNDSGNDGSNQNISSLDQSTSGGQRIKQEVTSDDNGNSSEGTASSNAAVVSGIGSDGTHQKHLDSIIRVKGKSSSRKRQLIRKEKTSLDSDFELNYQEVFLASNVPQLIATTSGRIVTCNKFFYRVTGLTQYEVKQVTIFSLVQFDMLPFLYGFVAERLREVPPKQASESDTSASEGKEEKPKNLDKPRSTSAKTITLPAVKFPKRMTPSKNPLFITLTFMIDKDPSKCCIHCAVTDTIAGTDGKVGLVTSELLNTMYSPKIRND